MMESKRRNKSVLVFFLILSCFLLPLAAVPLSRSLSLENHESPALEVADQVMATEGRDLKEATARMDIEVNDYPGSGANNRHDPKSPGRA